VILSCLVFEQIQMKSINEYNWLGHKIEIQASASPKYLWLDYKFDVFIDNQPVSYLRKRSLIRTHTSFTLLHQGQRLKGHVLSTGFPCTPVISQSTIVDDTILGRNQMLVSKRIFSYAILLTIVLGFNIL